MSWHCKGAGGQEMIIKEFQTNSTMLEMALQRELWSRNQYTLLSKKLWQMVPGVGSGVMDYNEAPGSWEHVPTRDVRQETTQPGAGQETEEENKDSHAIEYLQYIY